MGEIPEERVERSGRQKMSDQWRLGESEWRPEREYYDDGEGERPRPTARSYGGYSGVERTSPRYERGYTAPTATPRSMGRPGVGTGGVGASEKGAALPDFRKGETVLHKAFGRGTSLTITQMGGDALIEVAFDSVGTKKLMLKSAAQYMEKQ